MTEALQTIRRSLIQNPLLP